MEAIGSSGVAEAEVSVSVVGKRKMLELSKRYLKDEKLHDVLSFPFEDPGQGAPFVVPPDGILRLGEIVVCYPAAVAEAEQQNILVNESVLFLVRHGCEHLLGRHHE